MKKLFIIFAITFLAVTVNAQCYIGGQLGIGVHADRVKDKDNPDLLRNITSGNFTLAPKVGYYIKPKLAVGVGVFIGTTFDIDATNKKSKQTHTSIDWGIYPFVRYSVVTYKKFAFILEGNIGVGGKQSFTKNGTNKTEKGLYTTTIDVFNISPVLSYNFTDHLQLEINLDFLDVGYHISIATDKEGTKKQTNTLHDFNIGFNSNKALIMSSFRIGFNYKF
jgi:long-subunit fatty acid transport protein